MNFKFLSLILSTMIGVTLSQPINQNIASENPVKTPVLSDRDANPTGPCAPLDYSVNPCYEQ